MSGMPVLQQEIRVALTCLAVAMGCGLVSGLALGSRRRGSAEPTQAGSAPIGHGVPRHDPGTDIAAGVLHEIKQPLLAASNFITAGAMALQNGEDRDLVVEMLNLAREQTSRAGEIVNRMHELAAGSDLRMTVEPVAATLHAGGSLALVGLRADPVPIAYDLHPEARLMRVDRVQVQQVLANLIRNSVEAMRSVPPAQREIVIAARAAPEEMVEVSVSDTGPGIAPPVLSRLGTPVDSTKGGMGMGLAICRRIVEAHGGRLAGYNRPSGGACFRFTLPLVTDRPQLA